MFNPEGFIRLSLLMNIQEDGQQYSGSSVQFTEDHDFISQLKHHQIQICCIYQ